MQRPPILSEADHRRVSDAVAAAEAHTSGEIVTIVADRSDGYDDVALAWAALVAFVALTALALLPDFYLALVTRVLGHWNAEHTPRFLFALAAFVGTVKFAGTWLLLLWQPLRFALIPSPIKAARVRDRAIACFRIGAERRTRGRTGILIYLSMREHRAEIVADESIAGKLDPAVWGDAMAAMLVELKDGRTAEGMIAAVGKVGALLAAHLPSDAEDTNELPDRLIEV